MTMRRTHFVVLILCIFFCEGAAEGYTLGAAFAGRREKTEGSLKKCKLADLIIVSQNIFEIDAHKISETKVRTTIVGGQVVYQSDAK